MSHRLKIGIKRPLKFSLPQCDSLFKNHCKWHSDMFGRPFVTTVVFCERFCKIKGGPYCGRRVNNIGEYLYKVFKYKVAYDFMMSFIWKYRRGAEIVVPPEWSEIKKQIGWLKGISGISLIGLTGSLVVKGTKRPPKDYDIVVQFEDFETLLKQEKDLKQRLPKKINGVTVEYFFLTKLFIIFFAVVDVDKRKVYPSSWGTTRIKAPGFEIIKTERSDYIETMWKLAIKDRSFGLFMSMHMKLVSWGAVSTCPKCTKRALVLDRKINYLLNKIKAKLK